MLFKTSYRIGRCIWNLCFEAASGGWGTVIIHGILNIMSNHLFQQWAGGSLVIPSPGGLWKVTHGATAW